jgi:hypothetical protein
VNRRPSLGSRACVCAVMVLAGIAHAEEPDDSIMPGELDETTLTIDTAQSTLTLGIDKGTTLFVTVTGPLAAAAIPARTQATVGTIGPLVPASTPGSFSAAYRVPTDQIPQSAIISLEVSFPGGARAHATTRLMLPAATTFPLRSSPDASVSLDITGRVFGPIRADGNGNVSIPIVVPPDVGVGRARAVNQFGIAKETDVDLQARDYPRVLLIAPPDGEAGSTVDVEVWAVEASGDPSEPEDIDLRASAGTLRRAGGTPGMARFTFTLPVHVAESELGVGGAVALVAATGDGTSMRPDAIVVRAGPASQIVIGSDVKRLVVATPTVAHLTATAQDRFGNVVPTRGMVITADGRPLPARPTPTGATADIAAPTLWQGLDRTMVGAALGKVHASLALPLTGGAPARVRLTPSLSTVNGDGKSQVPLVLEVFDDRDTPTAAGRVTWQADDDGIIDPLAAPRFGAYAVRFIPRPVLRDRSIAVAATVDAGLTASARVVAEAGATRTAAFRVGVAWNLGNGFGQTAFIEATQPLRSITHLGRLGRLLSLGFAVGYVHSEVTTSRATLFPAVHLEIDQAPILILGRIRLPRQGPVEVALSGAAGLTFASTALGATTDSQFGPAHGTARALVVGLGADTSVQLHPGEMVIGARYLHADLGRNSNGDHIDGNILGFMCDLGFRMGF